MLVIAIAAALAAAPAGAAPPSGGAQGLGDYLFPTLGNPGYDARHHTLDVRYPNDKQWTPAQVIYKAPVADAASDTQKIHLQLPNPQYVDSGLQVLVRLPEALTREAPAAAASAKP